MGMYGHNKPGRPKLTPEMRDNLERRVTVACKRMSVRGLKLLGDIMEDEKADPRVRLQAIAMILDRGLGKPKMNMEQKIDITVNGYAQALNAAEKRALARAGGEALDRAITHDVAVSVQTSVDAEDAEFFETNDESAESVSPNL